MRARHLLQLILLVQAVAACAIAAAAIHWLDFALWQGAVLGLASVALVRLVINANNFLLSARVASPTPPALRPGPLARMRLLLEEFASSMAVTSWHVPRGCAYTRIHPQSGRPPVLLLHGYGCNSGFWAHLAPLLERAGISHAALDLAPLTGDIDGYAAQIEAGVEQLCAQTGATQVAIVAHSMGCAPSATVGWRAWSRSARRTTAPAWLHSGSGSTRPRCGATAALVRPATGCARWRRAKTPPRAD
jgi:pimeloyl-ACP methyl ester carboxylesterase